MEGKDGLGRNQKRNATSLKVTPKIKQTKRGRPGSERPITAGPAAATSQSLLQPPGEQMNNDPAVSLAVFSPFSFALFIICLMELQKLLSNPSQHSTITVTYSALVEV